MPTVNVSGSSRALPCFQNASARWGVRLRADEGEVSEEGNDVKGHRYRRARNDDNADQERNPGSGSSIPEARPVTGGKSGAKHGIDGRILAVKPAVLEGLPNPDAYQ